MTRDTGGHSRRDSGGDAGADSCAGALMARSRYLAGTAGILDHDGRLVGRHAKEPTLTAPMRAAKVVAALVSVVLFASITAAYGYYRYKFGEINKIDIFGPDHADTAAGGAVNFLLVG